MTAKKKNQDGNSELKELLTLVKAQQQQINDLKASVGQQTTTKKSKKEDKKLLPFSEKSRILKELTIEERKHIVPKNRYLSKDDVFPLDKKDMIAFFHAHDLDGNPWITYSEQIDHFLIPLKTEYKITEKKWESKLNDMVSTLKGKVIEKTHRQKDKALTEGERKALGYQISSLNSVISKIEGLE